MFSLPPLPTHLPPLNGATQRDRAIVATLIYFDLFNYPLRAHELARFAHHAETDGHFAPPDVSPESEWWSSRDNYWFLKGREALVGRRSEMERASGTKLARAHKLARWLQIVPGVRFIGVTGSLAMESAVEDDDIDFLIITARGRLWLTRAFVLGTLWLLRVKRADDGRADHPNQICVNIFLREDDLAISDHNLFIAHEICQMKPLLGADAYQRFLDANAWVDEHLPQWIPPPPVWEDRGWLRGLQRVGEFALGGFIGAWLERELARRQLARIKNKHARGHNVGIKLSTTQLRFTPRDLSDSILNAFDERWRALNQSQND